MYEIEKGLPIQQARYKRTGVTSVLRSLKVGDSILVPFDENGAVRRMAYQCGIKITGRKLSPTQYRIWRTA